MILKPIKFLNYLLKLFDVTAGSYVATSELLSFQEYNAVELTSLIILSDSTRTALFALQSLAFLFPLLRIQAELYKKIEDDPNSSNIYKWIKENIDNALQSQPEFVNVLTTW